MSRRVDGINAWLWQRISALYLGGFLIYLTSILLCSGTMTFIQWQQWLADPVHSTLILIGFVMLFLHAWIGIKDVAIDYISSLLVRSIVLMLLGLAFMVALVWSSRVLILVLIQ